MVADGEESRKLIEQNRKRIEQNDAILEEVRRENRQTRRIWIATARHHGWPEDWLDRDDLDWEGDA